MKRISIYLYVRKNMLSLGVVGLAVCLVGVGVITTSSRLNVSVDKSSQIIQNNELEPSSPSSAESEHVETEAPKTNDVVSPKPTVAMPDSSQTSTQSLSQSSTKVAANKEFGIAYLYLSSPVVYCSGGGEYYNRTD